MKTEVEDVNREIVRISRPNEEEEAVNREILDSIRNTRPNEVKAVS